MSRVGRGLTAPMRDVLIEHIDGPVQIINNPIAAGPQAMQQAIRRHTIKCLLARGMLRATIASGPNAGVSANLARPTHTQMTEAGREELCRALGDWADAIERANLGKQERDFVRSPKPRDGPSAEAEVRA